MSTAKRPKSDQPLAEQRTITDDQGRHWTGSVSSGRFEDGEQNAEVIWVCDDQPSEVKRTSDLGIPPGQADDEWKAMANDAVEDVFRRSRPA